MTDTNQLPPLPEPEGVIVVGTQALRGFTADQMRAYALQARAQVQGEPSWWMRETDEGAEWTDTAPLVLSGWTPLYTTPQPAQATQAEVPDGIRPEDFTVDVVVKSMGGFAPANTQGVRVTHKPTGISVTCDVARSQHTNRHQAFETLRAILALRPERVPMTEDQVWHNDALMSANGTAGFKMDALMRIVRAAEAHHGITAQAKKETP